MGSPTAREHRQAGVRCKGEYRVPLTDNNCLSRPRWRGESQMRLRSLLCLGIASICTATHAADTSPVDWVNTFIGTGGSGPGPGDGGTMPLVTTPFGMTNWTAQTRQNRISVSSYAYEDGSISGFIGTHQPAVWMGDYGYVTLMPET